MKFKVNKESVKGDTGFGEILISPDETNGYRPVELFVSSLVGCSGSILKNILVKKRYSFQEIEIDVSLVRNPDKVNRIEQISINAYVEAEKPLPPQQAEKIADLVVKNCGMIQSVIQAITILYTVKSIPLKS